MFGPGKAIEVFNDKGVRISETNEGEGFELEQNHLDEAAIYT